MTEPRTPFTHHVERMTRSIYRHRERYLRAWIAATGVHPTEAVWVERPMAEGRQFYAARAADVLDGDEATLAHLRAEVERLQAKVADDALKIGALRDELASTRKRLEWFEAREPLVRDLVGATEDASVFSDAVPFEQWRSLVDFEMSTTIPKLEGEPDDSVVSECAGAAVVEDHATAAPLYTTAYKLKPEGGK